MSLAQYNQRYEQIMQLDIPDDQKAVCLASLMTEMEREFHISVFRFKEWEKLPGNQEIASLYQKISRSREW